MSYYILKIKHSHFLVKKMHHRSPDTWFNCWSGRCPFHPVHRVRAAAAATRSPLRSCRKWKRRCSQRSQRLPRGLQRWGWTSTRRYRFGQAAWALKGWQKKKTWLKKTSSWQFGQCNGEIQRKVKMDHCTGSVGKLAVWSHVFSLPNIEASVGCPWFQFWDRTPLSPKWIPKCPDSKSPYFRWRSKKQPKKSRNHRGNPLQKLPASTLLRRMP